MRSAHNAEDLSFEPSLRDMLADPIIRAVMARDGVSEDEVLHVSLAARVRLLRQAEAHDHGERDAVVMPVPAPPRPGRVAAASDADRPRTSDSFSVAGTFL